MNLKMKIGLKNIPKDKKEIIVIIDAFRSSATLNYAFKKKAKKIILFNTISQIYKHALKNKGLLCGEKNGLKPVNFNLGNSPEEYTNVKNKTIFYTSGFGAKAVLKSKAKFVYLVGFTNIKYFTEYILKKHKNKTIYFIVDGKKQSICMDDYICLGLIISKLESDKMDIGCKIATNIIYQYQKIIMDLIYSSPPVNLLLKQGFKKDVEFCIFKKINILIYKKNNELRWC